MSDFAAMDIASSGMAAQRARLRVIAENLANIHTTGPNGPYQRKTVALESQPVAPSFQDAMDSALADVLTPEEIDVLEKVTVSEIVPSAEPPVMRYEPNHPHADQDGYVAYPNISIVREMADMMEASRSYEANLAASKMTKDMILQAMDLLGS
jgi:flagellar basal-body rod protein FlgC